jgi:hypothetical protein
MASDMWICITEAALFFSTCPGLNFVARMFGPVDISGKVVQVAAV